MAAELLDYALFFARSGFRVFQCQWLARYEPGPFSQESGLGCSCTKRTACGSPGKHPVRLNWQDEATTDPAAINKWWGGGGPFNIGIVTGTPSGIVVLDVDPGNGGAEALTELENRYGELPSTIRFLTGGGGTHILFKHPGGCVSNSASKIGLGLDIRGDGGLIIAPPSTHISGRRYAISVDHHPDDVPLAYMPEWLHALAGANGVKGSKRKAHGPVSTEHPDWPSFAKAMISEGGRNNALASLCGFLLQSSVAAEWTLLRELIHAWNCAHCTPALDRDEVDQIIDSISEIHFMNMGE
jgi:putative DNA primase/helicase